MADEVDGTMHGRIVGIWVVEANVMFGNVVVQYIYRLSTPFRSHSLLYSIKRS